MALNLEVRCVPDAEGTTATLTMTTTDFVMSDTGEGRYFGNTPWGTGNGSTAENPYPGEKTYDGKDSTSDVLIYP